VVDGVRKVTPTDGGTPTGILLVSILAAFVALTAGILLASRLGDAPRSFSRLSIVAIVAGVLATCWLLATARADHHATDRKFGPSQADTWVIASNIVLILTLAVIMVGLIQSDVTIYDEGFLLFFLVAAFLYLASVPIVVGLASALLVWFMRTWIRHVPRTAGDRAWAGVGLAVFVALMVWQAAPGEGPLDFWFLFRPWSTE
jgi:hypothetical protein